MNPLAVHRGLRLDAASFFNSIATKARAIVVLEDLKWLVPMVAGTIGFLGCTVALFRSLSNYAVLIVAILSATLIGASVFSKVSFTKEGLIVETAKQNLTSLQNLEMSAKNTAAIIDQLTNRLDSLSARVDNLLPKTTGAGAAPTDKAVKDAAKAIDEAVKRNEQAIGAVGKSNELAKQNLNKIIDQRLWHIF